MWRRGGGGITNIERKIIYSMHKYVLLVLLSYFDDLKIYVFEPFSVVSE